MTRKMMVLIGVGALALILITAGASAFVTSKMNAPEEKPKVVATSKAKTEKITWNEPRQAAQPVQQVPSCDDGNVVGLVLGGAAGGLAGNQIGKGNGNTAATIGGAVGGAFLGKEYIPTKNVTCR